MNDLKNDINLREAVGRREQQLPPMPEGLNERVMGSLKEQKAVSKRLWLWPLVAAACVAGFVAIYLVPPRTVDPGQQLALEEPVVKEQQTGSIAISPALEALDEEPVAVEPSVKPEKAPRQKRVVSQEPAEVPSAPKALAQEPLLAEAESAQEEPEQEDVYQPKQPDLYLLAVAEAQDIRSRGEQLYQEVNQIIMNAKP